MNMSIQEQISSYVRFGVSLLSILLIILGIWLMGHIHRRQGKVSPSLVNRIEASLFIPFLSYLLPNLVIWVILFFVHAIWDWPPDTWRLEGTNLKLLMAFNILIGLPLWLVAGFFMWRAWIAKWPLKVKDLWLPFGLMMGGAVAIILLKLYRFFVFVSSWPSQAG